MCKMLISMLFRRRINIKVNKSNNHKSLSKMKISAISLTLEHPSRHIVRNAQAASSAVSFGVKARRVATDPPRQRK